MRRLPLVANLLVGAGVLSSPARPRESRRASLRRLEASRRHRRRARPSRSAARRKGNPSDASSSRASASISSSSKAFPTRPFERAPDISLANGPARRTRRRRQLRDRRPSRFLLPPPGGRAQERSRALPRPLRNHDLPVGRAAHRQARRRVGRCAHPRRPAHPNHLLPVQLDRLRPVPPSSGRPSGSIRSRRRQRTSESRGVNRCKTLRATPCERLIPEAVSRAHRDPPLIGLNQDSPADSRNDRPAPSGL